MKKIRILIIDDEKGYRDFYRFMLEPLGYEVSSAEDGEQGLNMALAGGYDMIFLDVHMPKMRGPEVLEKIKAANPDQLVVIFSSNSDSDFNFETNAREKGAFDCLFKPVDIEDILKVLNRAFEGKANGSVN